MYEFWLNFVSKVQINSIVELVQIKAWRRPGDKPLSELMMVSLLTHLCVTRPQRVNHKVAPSSWQSWSREICQFIQILPTVLCTQEYYFKCSKIQFSYPNMSLIVKTTSNGDIFHDTSPFCRESNGCQWIPLTKVSDIKLWWFFLSAPEQTIEQTIKMLVIWDAIVLVITSL